MQNVISIFFQTFLNREMPSKHAGTMSSLETDNGVVNLSSEYHTVILTSY